MTPNTHLASNPKKATEIRTIPIVIMIGHATTDTEIVSYAHRVKTIVTKGGILAATAAVAKEPEIASKIDLLTDIMKQENY